LEGGFLLSNTYYVDGKVYGVQDFHDHIDYSGPDVLGNARWVAGAMNMFHLINDEFQNIKERLNRKVCNSPR
jgi:hypothetical protein